MMSTNPRPNPYVGPRAFRRGEPLYGRDREVRELLDLLIAERIVLLYSPSGAGKTSLIRAGLIPKLEKEDFAVSPIVRISLVPDLKDVSLARPPNRYLLSTLLSLEELLPAKEQTPLAELAQQDLASYLDRKQSVFEEQRSSVLIFDQFEEFLTADNANPDAEKAWQVREVFFEQLGRALRNRDRWALFAMREEYKAGLDSLALLLPTRLRTVYRLDLLRPDDAQKASQLPARAENVDFTDDAAKALVENLRKTWVQRSDGTPIEATGMYVEPVHLQVVCHRLWKRLAVNASRISKEDVMTEGDVDQALADYYEDSLRSAAQVTGVTERFLRWWIANHLISAQKLRLLLPQEAGQTCGLPNEAVQRLVDAFLVRGEHRHGTTWYELTHDRLIDPIRKSNEQWHSRLPDLLRRATQWQAAGRPAALLLKTKEIDKEEAWSKDHPQDLNEIDRRYLAESKNERDKQLLDFQRQANRWQGQQRLATLLLTEKKALTEAQKWAELHPDELRPIDAEFLAASDKEQKFAQQRRDDRIFYSWMFVVLILFVFIVILNWLQMEKSEKEQQTRIAESQRLVREAINELPHDPKKSLCIALQAVDEATSIQPAHAQRKSVVRDATEALHRALQGWQPMITLRKPGADTTHDDYVYCVAFSPDGTYLATTGADRTVKVWRVAAGNTSLFDEKTLDGTVNAVLFSRDGQWLITAGAFQKDSIILWKMTASGLQQADRIAAAGTVFDVDISADGNYLAAACQNKDENSVKVWNYRQNTRQHRLSFAHAKKVLQVKFSHDGKYLATASFDKIARVWELPRNLEETKNYEETSALSSPSHPDVISGLAFHPTNNLQLTTCCKDGNAYIWDRQSAKPLLPLSGHTNWVYSVAYSHDGQWIATGSIDNTAKIWDARSGRDLLTLYGHSAPIISLAFHPHDARLATASNDKTAKLWDLPIWHTGAIKAVTFSKDGTRFATASEDRTAKVWDFSLGQRKKLLFTLTGHEGAVNALAFGPDGKRLVTGGSDATVIMWDISAKKPRALHKVQGAHTGIVSNVAFDAEGRFLATASDDNTMIVWHVGEERLTIVDKLEKLDWLNGLTFSPDGKRLATGTWNNTAKVWDLSAAGTVVEPRKGIDLQHRDLPKKDVVMGVAFSPDGTRLATAGFANNIVIWDTEAIRKGHDTNFRAWEGGQQQLYCICYSRTGNLLATGGSNKTIKVWDVDSGAENWILHGHAASVASLAFHPVEDLLASAGLDRTVRFWRIPLENLKQEARGFLGPEWTPKDQIRYPNIKKMP